MAEGDAKYDQFAVPIGLNEIPVGAIKRSELVLCLHYMQDSASTDAVREGLILEGLESGAVRKEHSLNGLFETGLIYVGLDELVPDSTLWQSGSYQLTVMLDGLTACVCEFELIA